MRVDQLSGNKRGRDTLIILLLLPPPFFRTPRCKMRFSQTHSSWKYSIVTRIAFQIKELGRSLIARPAVNYCLEAVRHLRSIAKNFFLKDEIFQNWYWFNLRFKVRFYFLLRKVSYRRNDFENFGKWIEYSS